MTDNIAEALDVFHDTLHGIRVRSAVHDAMEYAFTLGGPRNLSVAHNALLGNDFLKLQLLDMRKFFEEEKNGKLKGKTHIMDTLLQAADAMKATETYERLKRDIWEKDFETLANKALFHLDKEYRPDKDYVNRGDIERLSDELYGLLKLLTTKLGEKDISTTNEKPDLDTNGEYLLDIKSQALKFYDLRII